MSKAFGLCRFARLAVGVRACQRRLLVAIAVLGFAVQAGTGPPAALGQNLTVSSGTTTVSSGTTTYGQVLVAPTAGQTATLSLTGGMISATNNSSIGAGGTGTADVSGGTWNAKTLYVGLNAGSRGTLNVTGGTVTNISADLGYYAGGFGAAKVSGGAWNFSNYLFVGRSGTGTLEVTGGTVNSTWGYLGVEVGGVGTGTVSSGGSWVHSGGLNVGNRGTGTLTVDNGGLVTTTDRLTLGNDNQGTGGNGTLNILSGGQVIVGGSFNYGNGLGTHVLNLNAGGTLQIGTGGTSGSLAIPSLDYGGTIIFNRSDAYTLSGSLTGAGTVQKQGAGALTLDGNNLYTGPTTINGGSLFVNGKVSGAVSVNAGTLLGGSGTVAGAVGVASGGTLAPGATDGSTGRLSMNGLSGTAYTIALAISGTVPGTGYDQISATTLDYSGATLQISMTGTYANGTAWDLFDFTTQSGTLAGISPIVADSAYNGLTWGLAANSTNTFDQRYGSGIWLSSWGSNGQRLIFNQADGVLTVVPEPSTFVMAAAGLAGCVLLRWRRARRRAGDAAAKTA